MQLESQEPGGADLVQLIPQGAAACIWGEMVRMTDVKTRLLTASIRGSAGACAVELKLVLAARLQADFVGLWHHFIQAARAVAVHR